MTSPTNAWTLDAVSMPDSASVAEHLRNLESAVRGDGPPLEGFELLADGREMLRQTREIEKAALEAADTSPVLWVGFQRAQKLEPELQRYKKLVDAGVCVIAFGSGIPVPDAAKLGPNFTWIDVSLATTHFENQWFLVLQRPEPLIFVGWEFAPPDRFGLGQLLDRGREFSGYVTGDDRAVAAAAQYLAGRMKPHIEAEDSALKRALRGTSVSPARLLVPTDDGRDPRLANLRQVTARNAVGLGAELIFYDQSAASYWTDPFPHHEAENYDEPITSAVAASWGRHHLAEQLRVGEELGLDARAALPREPGFAEMARVANDLGADAIILPESVRRPGLVDRLARRTLGALRERTRAAVLLVDDAGRFELVGEPS